MAQQSRLEEELTLIPGLLPSEIELIKKNFSRWAEFRWYIENGTDDTMQFGYHEALNLVHIGIPIMVSILIYYSILDTQPRVNETIYPTSAELNQSRKKDYDIDVVSDALVRYSSKIFQMFDELPTPESTPLTQSSEAIKNLTDDDYKAMEDIIYGDAPKNVDEYLSAIDEDIEI